MRASRVARLAIALALVVAGAPACGLVLGLEPIEVIAEPAADSSTPADATTIEEAAATCDAGTACGPFCRAQVSASAPILYCNDFDLLAGDAGDLGFSGSLPPAGPIAFRVETKNVASPPNALAVEVVPGSGRTAVGGIIEVPRQVDTIRTRFSVGYDPVDTADGSIPNRTVVLVILIIDEVGAAIVFGVDSDRYFLSRTASTIDIRTSDVIAEAVLLPDVLRPVSGYRDFEIALEEVACPGDAGAARFSATLRNPNADPTTPGPLLACKPLPSVSPGSPPARVIFGGYVKDPVVPLQWRFDDIVVRGR